MMNGKPKATSLVAVVQAIQATVTQPAGVVAGFVRHGLAVYARKILLAAPDDLIAAGRSPHEWKSCAAMVLRILRSQDARYLDSVQVLQAMSGRAAAAEGFVVRAVMAYSNYVSQLSAASLRAPVRGLSAHAWQAIAADIENGTDLIMAFEEA